MHGVYAHHEWETRKCLGKHPPVKAGLLNSLKFTAFVGNFFVLCFNIWWHFLQPLALLYLKINYLNFRKYLFCLLYKQDENQRFSCFRPSRVFDRKEKISRNKLKFLYNRKENQYIKGCKFVTFLLYKKSDSNQTSDSNPIFVRDFFTASLQN